MNSRAEKYASEISPLEPCGPDLYETSAEFAGFLDQLEELLPEFYDRFDRSTVAFGDVFKRIDGFMARTRDLRLLVIAAQYRMLYGDIHGFANAVRTIRLLVERQWAHVHPVADGTDFTERLGTVEILGQRTTVLLPLDDAALFRTKISGPVSFRALEVAKGLKTPRGNEPAMSEGRLEEALKADDLEQEAIEDMLADLHDLPLELEAISALCRGHVEAAGAKTKTVPTFVPLCERLRAIEAEMNGRFTPWLAKKTGKQNVDAPADKQPDLPGTAPPASAVASSASAIDISSTAHARLVLKAIETYFSLREPSHPALFLVREAHGLVGKSFLDAIKILAPQRFEYVNLKLGESGLQISNPRLQELNQASTAPASQDDTLQIAAIASRDAAIGHIIAVKDYFARHEPSSPIPLLLDEARKLGDVSFSGLLGMITGQGNG